MPAHYFDSKLIGQGLLEKITRFRAHVYGSLSFTGRGHGTDHTIIGGLAGYEPDTVDTAAFPEFVKQVMDTQTLTDIGSHQTRFDYACDFVFHSSFLPLHENGMRAGAFIENEIVAQEIFYSIGGGFVATEKQFAETGKQQDPIEVSYPYQIRRILIRHCSESRLPLSEVTLRNECALHPEQEVRTYAKAIWQTMSDCIHRGLNTEDTLPGQLQILRQAPLVKKQLENTSGLGNDPMGVVDWINMVVFAVNEENAAGGQVVTAPTNGACGIVPAVPAYYDRHIRPAANDRFCAVCSCAAQSAACIK